MGNLDRYEHKGFDNLLDIVHDVFKTHPNWKLKMIGSGENGLSYLKEKARRLELEDKIEFLGFRKDVKEIMAKSDIYILASRYEGLPMVLIEAMSQGMACIAYDCVSGPSDIIEDGENGILVSNQNKEEMIQKLGELINDEEKRELFRVNALQSIGKFSIDNIGKKWETLLQGL